MLILFAYAFVILPIEVYCKYLFMIPVLPLQLLPLTFAADIAVIVFVLLPSHSYLPFVCSSSTAHANTYFMNCLKDVVSGCPSDFAVAVNAAKKDPRVCQHHSSHPIPIYLSCFLPLQRTPTRIF